MLCRCLMWLELSPHLRYEVRRRRRIQRIHALRRFVLCCKGGMQWLELYEVHPLDAGLALSSHCSSPRPMAELRYYATHAGAAIMTGRASPDVTSRIRPEARFPVRTVVGLGEGEWGDQGPGLARQPVPRVGSLACVHKAA